MAIREIREKGDEILYKKCKAVVKFDEKLHIQCKAVTVSDLQLRKWEY